MPDPELRYLRRAFWAALRYAHYEFEDLMRIRLEDVEDALVRYGWRLLEENGRERVYYRRDDSDFTEGAPPRGSVVLIRPDRHVQSIHEAVDAIARWQRIPEWLAAARMLPEHGPWNEPVWVAP